MKPIDKKCISAIRVLSAEAIQKANSGHPGMPLGSAPMAYALWKQMRHNPADPDWQGRDRFVLSAGHASALLYSLLHLFGYKVTMDDMKQFRQFGSATPGHPEYGHTEGVEATSGPLGQGIATAVGLAMAEAHMAEHFNREDFPVVDNYTYVLMGDGCLMEGVSGEAASLAGAQKLGKLIALYDRNKITIEGSTDIAFTEDVAARFTAYGWQVQQLPDGEDIDAIDAAIQEAKAATDKPSLIIVNTKIAAHTPLEGSEKSHGSPIGQENIDAMKKALDWDDEKAFSVPVDVYANFAALRAVYAAHELEYNVMFTAYKLKYPELYREWREWHSNELPEELLNDESLFAFEKAEATRVSSGTVLNKIAAYLPNLIGGSADLEPANKCGLKGKPYFSAADRSGVNVHFGVREFAMATACNGMALYGGLRPFCATFLVFADYLKPALRLSALMKKPVMYILTHDSIGVGEDGPTHQPIEQLASLRATPDTLVFRPADGKETAACYLAALSNPLPSAMVMSRQNLTQHDQTGKDAMHGGYILRDSHDHKPDVILIATGSEVDLIYKAADILSVQGYTARLVSMPCMELFEMQSEEYKQSVLPKEMRKRVAVEAGSAMSWHKYVGLDGATVCIDHFGASAPAGKLFEAFGFTPENVAEVALGVIKA